MDEGQVKTLTRAAKGAGVGGIALLLLAALIKGLQGPHAPQVLVFGLVVTGCVVLCVALFLGFLLIRQRMVFKDPPPPGETRELTDPFGGIKVTGTELPQSDNEINKDNPPLSEQPNPKKRRRGRQQRRRKRPDA